MKKLIKMAVILAGCASLDPVLAQPPQDDARAADTVRQLVHDWASAMTVVDFARLDQIIADDWIEGYPDKAFTKAAFVADVKSGKHKLEACDFGPIDVKVLGDVAVVQGSATEHMSVNGQDSVLHTAFMDVFMKRSGKWVVIRSQSHKL